ncbi:hypothetical protein BV898_03324 [Hypsibius exemplaris]|uniref:Globin domain-containing protein n=1 Tax=Hypsibius exemplaris TaxID=2072580 RepID=A0A1W0X5X7_HYPEX|nr:hypothetical protein BV898_03324 [Hypsibius exemplaris]
MADLHKTVTDLEMDKDPSMDVADKTTGLAKRERLVVQETWKEAGKLGWGTVGLALFNLYFDRHPEYILMFRAFKDISREDLRTHARLKAHGLNVVNALTGVIENLEDTETTVLLLEKTGRDHVRRKLHSKHFENLHLTVIELFRNVLGPNFTPFVEASWNKALTVVMGVVLNSLKQEKIAQGVTDEE